MGAALNRREWDDIGTYLAPDFRFHGHGMVLWGELDRDQYVDASAHQWGSFERFEIVVRCLEYRSPTVALSRIHQYGRNADGSEMSWDFASVARWRGSQCVEFHLFELEDHEHAIRLADELAAGGRRSVSG